MDSVTATGLNSISAAFSSAADNANKLSRFDGSTADVVQSVISLIIAKQQVQASTAVIKTDDQIQQSLLDLKA